jgi:hypothetical protein
LEWGEYEKSLRKRNAKGKRTPALEKKPFLYDDLIPVWQAFNQLHSTRQSGFGLNPISTADIDIWLKLHNVENSLDYYDLILAMDTEWLKWASDKQKQEHEAKKKKGKK